MKLPLCWCFLVLASSTIAALHRDPFSYGGTFHLCACLGIGRINNELYCARIYDDGVLTMLKVHDSYGSQKVVRIAPQGITFKESNGLEHHIVLELPQSSPRQKSPST